MVWDLGADEWFVDAAASALGDTGTAVIVALAAVWLSQTIGLIRTTRPRRTP